MTTATKVLLAAAFLAVPLAACESAPTAPGGPTGEATLRYGATGDATPGGSGRLVDCPVLVGGETTFVIAPEGGTIALGKSRLVVPPGAVAEPTTIRFALLAGPHLVADLTANGLPSFQFDRPLEVTLDYSRCRQAPPASRLTIWYIDVDTGALLQDMRGVADGGQRTITFHTDHFSGYALAE
jgi:hypothetical protein